MVLYGSHVSLIFFLELPYVSFTPSASSQYPSLCSCASALHLQLLIEPSFVGAAVKDLCKHALTVFPIANPYEVLGLLQGARASLDLDLILSASLLADLHGISDIHWRRRQNVVGFYYSTHCRASGFFCRCSLSGQPLLPHECLVRLGPSGSCCLREMTTDVRPECLDCCGGSAGASAAGAAADYATGLPGCAC